MTNRTINIIDAITDVMGAALTGLTVSAFVFFAGGPHWAVQGFGVTVAVFSIMFSRKSDRYER